MAARLTKPLRAPSTRSATNGSRGRQRKALVSGRIGLVRSLGREGIPVVLARDGRTVFERASRYCREFLTLPNYAACAEAALEALCEYGARQEEKPVAFFNGETDLVLFSQHRETLSEYFEILLAPHPLVRSLVDKDAFGMLAAEHDLPVPRTLTPKTRREVFEAAEQLGYPCVVKPVTQCRWHDPRILEALGLRKAMLVSSPDEMESLLDRLPDVDGGEMVQQYIPGDDSQHFDCHLYLDRNGTPRGTVVGQKLRIYPIHFGSGCYARRVDNPEVESVSLQALAKLGYTGAANINLKRHAATGEYHILEINPRFSLWTILDAAAGVNLPLMQYCEAVGEELPVPTPPQHPVYWRWLGADVRALAGYRRSGEMTRRQCLRSLFSYRRNTQFHVFAWDDPLPVAASWWFGSRYGMRRLGSFLKRRPKRVWTSVRNLFAGDRGAAKPETPPEGPAATDGS